jgi:DNA-binding NarL/FixJ family response regulator
VGGRPGGEFAGARSACAGASAPRGDPSARAREAPLITVLIADDHPFVRRSLTDLFAATDDIAVVAECAGGSEVLAAALATRPEVVLMDLVMPDRTGLEATRDLLDAGVPSRVVLLTGSCSAASVREARALGAAGYLLKDDDPAALPGLVREVAAGGSVWSARATASLLDAG